ncbi:cytochrome P450 alkane hydroxylase-like protein [Halenospora varia]|nr:cytochrome P450 alkane hydroxylase-like protein [Halenospora varia]
MALSVGVLIIICFVCVYPVYQIWTSISYRVAVYRAGCSMPTKYRHKFPILGLDLFKKRIDAIKSGKALVVDQHLFSTYGKTVETNSFGTKQYVTMDLDNIQAILATQVEKFGSAPMSRALCQPFLGDGILTTDGALWKRSRQLVNPIFARAQVSELSTFDVHVKRMIDLIPRDGSTIDLQPLFKKLFMDSTTEFIFGKSANALCPERSSVLAQRLPAIFDDALRGLRKRFLMGKLGFLAGNDKEWLGKCAEVHAIVDTFIDEEIELQKAKKEVPTKDTPYSYILLRELVKTTDDKKFIRNELMNVFFPSRDSAAVLTGNAIFLLARHPEIWNRARAEVLSIGEQKLTFELLKSLKFIHGIIHETLRVLSPVARSWKTCLETSILPHGGGSTGEEPILLQPGDQVDMAFSSMHIDPALWGSDSLEFKPERWLGRKQTWDFIPFLGGRRICPAQQNVLTDVSYILVRMMQEFKTCENRDECYEYVEEMVFTKESRNGVKVAFIPA